MKYLGGKYILGKRLAPLVKGYLEPHHTYVEPMVGGGGMLSHMLNIDNPIIANDIDMEVIAFWQSLQNGRSDFPQHLTREKYYDIKNHSTDSALRAYVGYGCSFGGKKWGGYAQNKRGTNYAMLEKTSANRMMESFRNFAMEAYNGSIQMGELFRKRKELTFTSGSYLDMVLPENCVIYCDPPYKNTTGMNTYKFDHNIFYDWVLKRASQGDIILISEYDCPIGQKIFEYKKTQKIDVKGTITRYERLYVVEE